MKGACCFSVFQFSSANLTSHPGNRPKEVPRCFSSCCMIEIISMQMYGSTDAERPAISCDPRIPYGSPCGSTSDAGLFDVHCRVWRSPHRRWAEPVGKLKSEFQTDRNEESSLCLVFWQGFTLVSVHLFITIYTI